ncbi:SAV_915 family protein [Haloechinothrix sp. LS1_15]|uniref:SAV_915 family protein n=1 Tax=Haloechinothrix sp. LS1_15 TaxID=2652248 RepID=UPI00294B6637|nr:SAV_915 family protein [Haloechinothrix sp. LS1_15]
MITGDMFADDEEEDAFPPVVYTPTATVWDGGEEPPALVLRQMDDGEVAMLVYTSLEALAAGCGQGQPYVSIRSEGLPEFQYWLGLDRLIWDAVLAPELRQHGDWDTTVQGGTDER